ncbi:MAG: hypothetical protein ACLVK4_16255 [Alistipes shahii]|uniref:hypothetical protein n=1 Tax=Alistipes shahii TaxID=328814 RepID=UPI00399D5138
MWLETIVYFGFCRVADRNQVRFVDLTVAVDVFVFDIAGHVRSESLNRRIGYVGFVDEQPFGDIAPADLSCQPIRDRQGNPEAA